MNDHNEQTTIMLVDDTPANLELLRAMLHKKGYKVLVFPGGEPALRALEADYAEDREIRWFKLLCPPPPAPDEAPVSESPAAEP